MKFLLKIIISLIYCALIGVYLNYWIKPSESFIFSFLGLGYRYIFVAYIVALVLSLLLDKRFFYLGIFVGIIGIKLNLDYYSIASPNKSTSDNHFKLLSYNVRLFNLYNDEKGETKQKIFDYLQQQDADIYCFQEFYKQDKPTKFETIKPLVKLLKTPYKVEYYSRLIRTRQYFGVLILSKIPIVNKGLVEFGDKKAITNFCIFADIVPKAGDTIRLFNAHLQSIRLSNSEVQRLSSDDLTNSPEDSIKNIVSKLKKAFIIRQNQTDKIVESIKKSPYPVILCGDFNDMPMSYSYLQFRKLLKDAFVENVTGIGRTYAGDLPIGRIDYILHDKRLNVFDFAIQKEALSDHYAIQTKFNF